MKKKSLMASAIAVMIILLYFPTAFSQSVDSMHILIIDSNEELQYVVVDEEGKLLHEPVNSPIEGAFEQSSENEYEIFALRNPNAKATLAVYFYKTRWFSGFIYQEVHMLSEGLMAVAEPDGYFGYIDENGQMIIPPRWDWAEDFENGKAIVSYETGYGYENVVINTEGKIISLDPY